MFPSVGLLLGGQGYGNKVASKSAHTYLCSEGKASVQRAQLGEGSTGQFLLDGGWAQQRGPWGASDLQGLERRFLEGKLLGDRVEFAGQMGFTMGFPPDWKGSGSTLFALSVPTEA